MIFANAAAQFGRMFPKARAVGIRRKFPWSKAFRFACLSLAIISYGILVGAMTVVLPPMFPIAAVAIPVLILLWAAPELRRAPVGLLRKVFYSVVIVETCVPAYYAVEFAGMPWLSIRRIIEFAAIILFSISVAGSQSARYSIKNALKYSNNIGVCVLAYYIMCALSILTSYYVPDSISKFTEITLNWYVPMLACIIVVRTTADVRKLLKLIGLCSLLVAAIGVGDFVGRHNYAIELMPKSLLNAMIEANPSLARVANSVLVRNGLFRANSIFNVPLSYGEFAAMVAPIGGYFIMHGETFREKTLGVLVVAGAMASLYVSGARGGSIAFLVSMPVFAVLWVVRFSIARPRSTAGPLASAVAVFGTLTVLGVVFGSRRLHNIVLGGGDTFASDNARFVQAEMAWQHILSNPITGHGLGLAGYVIGYHSPGGGATLDSYVLNLLVDTGIPGFLFFSGMLVFAISNSARTYVANASRDAAPGLAVSCSVLAFAVYRLVLSQQENQPLLFILLGVAIVIRRLSVSCEPQRSHPRASRHGYSTKTGVAAGEGVAAIRIAAPTAVV